MRGETRLSRDDVVERCQAIAAARREEDAEVLGVPVGCAEKPESIILFQEQALIRGRHVAAADQLGDDCNSRAGLASVSSPGNGERLTAILPRRADEAAMGRDHPVEALDDKDSLVAESRHLNVRPRGQGTAAYTVKRMQPYYA